MYKNNHFSQNNFNQKGFTLIELLVVVSIISLLSSIVMTSVSSARIRARDTAIREEMRQVQVALELYRVDHGRYPRTGFGPSTNAQSCWENTCGTLSDFPGVSSQFDVVGIDSLVDLLADKGYISSDVLKDFQFFNRRRNGYHSNLSHAQYYPSCIHKPYYQDDVTDEILNTVRNKGYSFFISLPNDHQFDVLNSTYNNPQNGQNYQDITYKDPFVGLIRQSARRLFDGNTLCASNVYLGR